MALTSFLPQVARNVRSWPGVAMAPEPRADADAPGGEGAGAGAQGASEEAFFCDLGGKKGSSLAGAYEAPSFEPARVREQVPSTCGSLPSNCGSLPSSCDSLPSHCGSLPSNITRARSRATRRSSPGCRRRRPPGTPPVRFLPSTPCMTLRCFVWGF